MRAWRGRLVWVLLLTVGVTLPVGGALLYRNSEFSTAPLRFRAARWKTSEPVFSHKSIRLRMAHDLMQTHALVGMSRDEIVDLLGGPNDTVYFRDYEMAYFLGLERGYLLAIDGEWLVIDLDEGGRAVSATLMTD